MVMSGTEDKLLIRLKLLVNGSEIVSRISSEFDDDAKLGLW